MKRNIITSAFLVLIFLSLSCAAQKESKTTDASLTVTSKTFSRAFNFIIISDWGWNGEKFQQVVADQMAKIADSVNTKFIISCGDNFQRSGVASTQDPLWALNFENVYRASSLQADWYPVLGNHDYKGSTQAQIDYSKISRRWHLSDHYYTFAKKVNDSISARFIFLDTPPLIAEYRNRPDEYPDAKNQDPDKEIKWLNDVLANAKEQMILVFGHHPVYSASKTHGDTKEMIEYVKPLLEKYHAQFYFCGHDHDFQHLHEKGGKVDYIVTGTGGEPRPSSTNEKSVFSKSEPGFSVISLKGNTIRVCFIDVKGNVIYDFSRSYK
ncbi:MAG: metallophosphoesterase [Bacteroidetes bacterium]|nr:metallophosphoesterase [Bacteroidota bacterium]